jgi:hypothetical protein
MQQRYRPVVFRPNDLATELAHLARARDLAVKAFELLNEPPPDTFLGRKHYEPLPLPHEEK